jgi:hypothetical protein
LNHDPPSTYNAEIAALVMSTFGAKPEISCSIRALTVTTRFDAPPIYCSAIYSLTSVSRVV